MADWEAFQELCGVYHPRVLRMARACTGNPHDAEDVAQQVMLKLLTNLPDYTVDVEQFDRWLYAVVRNQAIDHRRRERRAQPEEPTEINQRREGPDASPNSDAWRFDRELMPAIDLLPRQQRAVLLLRFGFGLSGPETARTLGCSAACIRQSQRRALAFLEQRLARPRHCATADL